MDYGPVDTSGTDDDLPPSHNNRVARGGRIAVNGRSMVGSVPFRRMHSDMESDIHQLEKEAYSSVLRAFKAQSDALTWEKEGLITELRKELRVSDDEHRELLARVNNDDIIRRIRFEKGFLEETGFSPVHDWTGEEWRQAGGQRGAIGTRQPVHDLTASPTAASRKKQKTSQSVPLSVGLPLRALHSQAITTAMQPSPSAAKRGHALGSGGKRPIPGQPLPGLSSMKSNGRGQFTTRSSSGAVMTSEPTEAATHDPLIGRKVMTRWPEDDNFYEAVITEYNPVEGRHALVYDINTKKETWEWVNLKEISPEDIRWVGDDPGISHHGEGVRNSLGHGVTSSAGRERESAIDQLKKDLPQLQNGAGKVSDEIEILHTETLIKEVEKVFGTSHPDLLEIEKAKKMLKEHERALIDVIEKLADASDSESDGGHQISHGQPMNGGWKNINSSEIQS